MSACQELEQLIALRASGEVAPADAARLDPHLAGCERCRAELAAFEETLSLARVPPPPDAAPSGLELATLAAYRRHRRRRVTGLTIGAGFVAAAVAASVVLVPAMITLRSLQQPRPSAAASAAVARQLDQATVEVEDSSDELTPEEAAMAALDEAL